MLIPSRAWGFLRAGLNGRYGVRLADAPTGGDHPSLVNYPGVWTEPQDPETEVCVVPLTLPLQGTLTVYADGSYIHGPITGSDPWTAGFYYVEPGANAQEATGSPATITDLGGASEDYSGGSQATVAVTVAGAGTAQESASGSGAAVVAVTVAGEGSGTEEASGGSQATVAVTAAGEGTSSEASSEDFSGGSAALVGVTSAGSGTGFEEASGAGAAIVATTASGNGLSSEDSTFFEAVRLTSRITTRVSLNSLFSATELT